MHQRHSSVSVPVATDNTTAATSSGSSSTGFRKRRKGPSSASSASRFGGRGGFGFSLGGGGGRSFFSPRQIRKLRQALGDEDVIVGLIQLASILILVGCAVTLFFHYFAGEEVAGGGDGGDDGDDSSEESNPSVGGGGGLFSFFTTIANYLDWVVQPGFMMTSQNNKKVKNARMKNGLYPRQDMTPSKIYTVPGSLSFVGDKSDEYARVRKLYDSMDLPPVEQKYTLGTMPMKDAATSPKAPPGSVPRPYDIFSCPYEPPLNYPYAWNLLEVLNHWGPDDPQIPSDSKVFQGLCIFDYEKDYDKAMNYRRQELPFVVKGDPEVQETAKRWNAPGFMERMLGNVRHRTEYSESNHFLYWQPPRGQSHARLHAQQRREGRRAQQRDGRGGGGKRNAGGHDPPQFGATQQQRDHNNDGAWKEPTTMMRMTYGEWLSHANMTEGETVGPDDPHWYFRLIGCGETGPRGECDKGSSEYLFDELPFFQPKESLYIVDPLEQKGIHCRFGMHGVIAENHFDMSRNAIVVLGGERRYVLAHPEECPRLSLLPKGHPSARHSAVDWSDPDLETYPEFAEARGNEVVLQAGDVLYLPTNWFHFIISLNLNFQCNTRSGISPHYMKAINECGF
mmetsp:Transcript_35156/g.85067  ORF Transcript_35156/g.85067 Transcript_35156/m.85067 type:complete len:622 (-) Transcript_35156:81-1946(-)